MSKQLTAEIPLIKIDNYRWEIPTSYQSGMRVPGLIFADQKILSAIRHDPCLQQVANVATLPGIVRASMAMPDIHWGYGFPIGGVAATDPNAGGVISPGGVGYDINCGVRLCRTNFQYDEIQSRMKELVGTLFDQIPCGVGGSGDIHVSAKEEREVMLHGAGWAVKKGYGVAEDVEHCEARGSIEGADPSKTSERARERGANQLGTLGSGNHFLEVQVVDQIYDEHAAGVMGLELGQVTVMIHSGSRGFGYQVCEDFLEVTRQALTKYDIEVPDRQLASAPIYSPEGQAYLGAMRCAANYAWANRQCLLHLARGVFERVFKMGWQKIGMDLIYDVAHNIAKFETYEVDGKQKILCIHRKGATRAFGPNHIELPEKYREIGQPVIIPGDMGRNSYVLVGTRGSDETFGSSCHGAGRMMSRAAAVKMMRGRSVEKELAEKGVIARGRGRHALEEEHPQAYKDVNEVVDVVDHAGIAKRVARMRPVGVIKG
ncbi:MAG: RtcB family protein [Candidatus Omnitrophica bacterium]|nr:RtcB family protein [Candidatus Omnitrophota bacterium]